MDIEKVMNRTEIMRLNSIGDQFYIILSGMVKIMIDDNPNDQKRIEYPGSIIEDINLYQKL